MIDLELLIFNDKTAHGICKAFARNAAIEAAKGHPDWTPEEHEVFWLADAIKGWVDDMVDDIGIRLQGFKPFTKNSMGEFQFRQELIRTATISAVNAVDYNALARICIRRFKEGS